MRRSLIWTTVWVICLGIGSVGAVDAERKQEPTVKLANGRLTGIHFGAEPNTAAFLGVPYAAPPVGGLRWKPPTPTESWRGTRDATQFGSPCAQLPAPWFQY